MAELAVVSSSWLERGATTCARESRAQPKTEKDAGSQGARFKQNANRVF